MLTLILLAVVLLASLPYWLPAAILRLRSRIFTGINGEEGIAIPGDMVDPAHLKQVYSHPAAGGRSRGAALSDLFWYWLSPGPEIHQEHIEPGERYDEVARCTQRILSLPKKSAEELAAHCVEKVLRQQAIHDARTVRLRDLMMPVWAEFYYALVFGGPCPPEARELIVGNANDVVTALKCCGLRHMDTRLRLTEYLVWKLLAREVAHPLPDCLTTEERAFYLQGVFFNTAVVQMSEAMTHLCLAVAQHPEIQTKIASNLDDERYLDRVIAETLRVYPLFGISHRITTDAIVAGEHAIPRGSVLCFNHPEYHRSGFGDPERFDPDRWKDTSPREANYIPFGVTGNRPCPAQALASITMRAALREIVRRFELYSSASHTRSIPHRGPCLLVWRNGNHGHGRRKAALLFMRIQDRWGDVWRSLVQLVLGTWMVLDARRQRLCQRYFEQQDNGMTPTLPQSACPFARNKGASALSLEKSKS